MVQLLERMNDFVWGVPALLLILGVGVYLTLRTGFAQLRLLPNALKLFVKRFTAKRQNKDGVSPYQALCTALAATVGTGNLAGVAGAIAIGGPGSVFWMWICAFFGMIIKFAEAALAVRYRRKNQEGEFVGGPMYMIQQGMGNRWAWLGSLYCFFGVVAAFGAGNATQINAMVGGVNSVIKAYGGQEHIAINLSIGIISGVLVAVLLCGGAKRIGRAAEQLVPFASVLYLLLGFGALILNYKNIPFAFEVIFKGVYEPRSVTGGVIGSAFVALRIGASRGVFTNEAGMGTASIAHASADVDHPVQQGAMGIIEVFLDTIVICTLTALVILSSGIDIAYGIDTGVELTSQAFAATLGGWVCVPIALILCCFAFATVLGWGLYGARCAQYLFGHNAWKKFVVLSVVMVVVGAIVKTGTVWMFSETINGLMAIPNLIAVAALSPELLRLLRSYKKSPTRLGRRCGSD